VSLARAIAIDRELLVDPAALALCRAVQARDNIPGVALAREPVQEGLAPIRLALDKEEEHRKIARLCLKGYWG